MGRARGGVVMLTPSDDISVRLAISEGIENGLSAELAGWPTWAALSPRGRVLEVSPASDRLAIATENALEVWTLPSRERGPVSVGLMQRARTLQLQLKDLPAPGPDQLFEITLEPATGSPTGRPTGPVLFKGNTALAL